MFVFHCLGVSVSYINGTRSVATFGATLPCTQLRKSFIYEILEVDPISGLPAQPSVVSRRCAFGLLSGYHYILGVRRHGARSDRLAYLIMAASGSQALLKQDSYFAAAPIGT